MHTTRLRAYSYLLVTVMIWGAAAGVIKFTLEELSPFSFLAYRFAISGVVALIILLSTRGMHLGLNLSVVRRNFHYIFLYGITGTTLALAFLFLGLDKSTVLDFILIAIASPLLVSLGGAYIFGDHVTRKEKIGTAVVILGVITAQLLPILNIDGQSTITGNIFLVGYLVFDLMSILVGKHLSRSKVPEAVTVNWAFIIAGVTLIPFAYLIEPHSIIDQITYLALPYHLGVWYMAILSGVVAYFFWLRGQKSIEVSEASLFYYLQPVITVPLAVIWLGEKISLHFIVGAVIIIVGLFIAERK